MVFTKKKTHVGTQCLNERIQMNFFDLHKRRCTRTCIRKQENDTRVPVTQPQIVRSILYTIVNRYLIFAVVCNSGGVEEESRREKTASERYTNRIKSKTTDRVDLYWILYRCIAISTVQCTNAGFVRNDSGMCTCFIILIQ